MRTASAVSKFPLALLADGDLFAVVRNPRELEAASDSAAQPGVAASAICAVISLFGFAIGGLVP